MAKKHAWKQWQAELRSRAEDIRAEVVIADLVLDGSIDLDDVFMLPNGGFHRIISKDIAALHDPGTTEHKTERAVVEVNRKGLYDGLPEVLFHQNRKPKSFRSIIEIKDEVKYHNEVERKARKFFSPLDQELLRTRSLIDLNERSMTTELLSLDNERGLRKFWSIPEYFSKKQQGTLILLLPLVHRLVKDLDLIAQSMQIVLDVPVEVTLITPEPLKIDSGSQVALGSGQLGVDMITGGVYQDDDEVALVRIGPISKSKSASFAYMQRGFQQFMYLSELLLPADMEVQLQVELKTEERDLVMHEDPEYIRLGVTTYLT